MAAGTSELTIDQLARRTGMTARNIRAHQSRALLARPTLRGRTGCYSDSHDVIEHQIGTEFGRLELVRRG
jgi:hypothetical protein